MEGGRKGGREGRVEEEERQRTERGGRGGVGRRPSRGGARPTPGIRPPSGPRPRTTQQVQAPSRPRSLHSPSPPGHPPLTSSVTKRLANAGTETRAVSEVRLSPAPGRPLPAGEGGEEAGVLASLTRWLSPSLRPHPGSSDLGDS